MLHGLNKDPKIYLNDATDILQEMSQLTVAISVTINPTNGLLLAPSLQPLLT